MSGGASLAALQGLVQAFNAHDLDSIMGFFADDAVLEMPRGPDPWGRRYVGAVAVREGLRARFDGLPDVHYGDDSHYVDGAMGISQWTVTGTTKAGERIQGARLRLLHLPQRQGGQEGFVLEDRREELIAQPHGPRRGVCCASAHGPRDGAAFAGMLDCPAMASRRAMRSSIGGWVENRRAMPPADSGLAM